MIFNLLPDEQFLGKIKQEYLHFLRWTVLMKR